MKKPSVNVVGAKIGNFYYERIIVSDSVDI